VSLHRNWRLRVEDIIESTEKVKQYTAGLDFESFAGNGMVVDAVVRNLEIVGEAARHVPPEIQARCPEVAWRLMNDMRNVLIHAYPIVDLATVWQVVRRDLPPTVARLRQLLEDEPDGA
jgi:uncharacterized protein with HEPN domain